MRGSKVPRSPRLPESYSKVANKSHSLANNSLETGHGTHLMDIQIGNESIVGMP